MTSDSRETGAGGARLLRAALVGERRALALGTLLGVGAQLSWTLAPGLVQRTIDDGVVAGDLGATWTWAAALLAVGVLQTLLLRGEQRVVWTAGARYVAAVRTDLATAVLDAGRAGSTAAVPGTGDLNSRCQRDGEEVWNWLSGIVSTIRVVVGIAACLVALALLDHRLALVGVAGAACSLAVGLAFSTRYRRLSADASAADGLAAGRLAELLAGLTTVRGLGVEGWFLRRHHEASGTAMTADLRLTGLGSAWSALAPAVPLAAVVAGLWVGGQAIVDGTLSVGALVAFSTWMMILTESCAGLARQQTERRQAAASAHRLAAVIDRPAVVRTDRTLPATGRLTAVGLDLAPGGYAVLRSPDGTDSTATVRGLSGLDSGGDGTRYGGVRLDEVADPHLADRVRPVAQHPVLLAGTIADNIRLGAPLTDDEIRTAAANAGLLDEIDAMPDGLATPIGDRGTGLSGGQRQRLAVARALATGPAVVVLDDALSALDEVTERMVVCRLRSCSATVALVSARGGER